MIIVEPHLWPVAVNYTLPTGCRGGISPWLGTRGSTFRTRLFSSSFLQSCQSGESLGGGGRPRRGPLKGVQTQVQNLTQTAHEGRPERSVDGPPGLLGPGHTSLFKRPHARPVIRHHPLPRPAGICGNRAGVARGVEQKKRGMVCAPKTASPVLHHRHDDEGHPEKGEEITHLHACFDYPHRTQPCKASRGDGNLVIGADDQEDVG